MPNLKLTFSCIYFFCYLLSIDAFAINTIYLNHNLPKRPLINPETGASWKAVVVIDKATLTLEPGGSKNLSQPLDFMEVVTLYKRTNNKDYYLVKRDSGQSGWIKSSDILINTYCMKSPAHNNPAYLKIFVNNNWRLKKGLINEIPIRNGPGEHYPVIDNVCVFKIRYAFKNDGKNQYIFVGNEHLWNNEAPAACLSGWIHRDYCIMWDNPVATYYIKDNFIQRPPVQTYTSNDDLKMYLNYSKKEHYSQKVISIEDTSLRDTLDFDTTRFPVLDNTGNFFQISWIGDSIDTETGQKVPSKLIKKVQSSVNQNIYDKKKIDIEAEGDNIEASRMSKFNQYFEKGWGSKKSIKGLNQFESCFLITRQKFDMLLYMIWRLFSKVATKRNIVQSMIELACETATGEVIQKSEKISVYIQRVFGIPYRDVSTSLQYSPEELEDKLASEKFKKEFLNNLSRKIAFLSLILA